MKFLNYCNICQNLFLRLLVFTKICFKKCLSKVAYHRRLMEHGDGGCGCCFGHASVSALFCPIQSVPRASPSLQVVIHWFILNEECYTNMDRNLSCCIIRRKIKRDTQIKLNYLIEEMNQLHRNGNALWHNVGYILRRLAVRMGSCIGYAQAISF
jgi:hypothetical protein